MDYVYLIVGLALILFGASWLTDGASDLARRWGVSDLVIGLTIVAFGTSAPELVISIVSALNGNSGIAIGNVVGSNIFNILMITGCTALVMPLGVGRSTLSKEIPLVILSSLVLWFCSADMLIDGASENVVSRADGLVLLAFFLIFMRYTFSIARDKPADAVPKSATVRPMKAGISVLYVVAGLAGLVFGGQGFVKGASGIASSLGVSDAVIGLTIVAAGTSLPELATSIVAAIKKNPGIAIGNVVGSSIFNAFFIMGAAATISPMKVEGISTIDYAVLIGASLLLYIFGQAFGQRTIRRWEGAVMAICFVLYTVWLVVSATRG